MARGRKASGLFSSGDVRRGLDPEDADKNVPRERGSEKRRLLAELRGARAGCQSDGALQAGSGGAKLWL